MKNDIPDVSIKDVIIEWTPWHYMWKRRELRGRARLVAYPTQQKKDHSHDCGGCDHRTFVLSTALGMILRDRIHPDEVHRALWPIKEYREALCPDTAAPKGDDRYGAVANGEVCWL
jgi:hypothetical protein